MIEGENRDTRIEGENRDAMIEGENRDTGIEGENRDTRIEGENRNTRMEGLYIVIWFYSKYGYLGIYAIFIRISTNILLSSQRGP